MHGGGDTVGIVDLLDQTGIGMVVEGDGGAIGQGDVGELVEIVIKVAVAGRGIVVEVKLFAVAKTVILVVQRGALTRDIADGGGVSPVKVIVAKLVDRGGLQIIVGDVKDVAAVVISIESDPFDTLKRKNTLKKMPPKPTG